MQPALLSAGIGRGFHALRQLRGFHQLQLRQPGDEHAGVVGLHLVGWYQSGANRAAWAAAGSFERCETIAHRFPVARGLVNAEVFHDPGRRPAP